VPGIGGDESCGVYFGTGKPTALLVIDEAGGGHVYVKNSIVAAGMAQQFRDLFVALKRRKVQRRIATVAPDINIGTIGQQKYRHVFAAPICGKMQRRPAVPVAGIHVGVICEQQFRDFFCGALLPPSEEAFRRHL
jgi:hypothetical protein